MTATGAPRIALVTGASKGIGQALSLALVRVGVEVYGSGRDTEGLEQTLQLCKPYGTFHPQVAEVRSEADVERVVAEPPRLDFCFNNAGIARWRPFLETPLTEIEEIVAVNVLGAFLVMKAAAARMAREGGGRIVTIASDAATKSIPEMGPYVASKHAISGLSKTVADELASSGVQVTTVYPSGVHTSLLMKEPLPPIRPGRMDPDELAGTIVAAMLAAGTTVRIAELHLQGWKYRRP
ncbi:NAD(P)-dependent dehydrogenase (short-subunit alcohol dehydrogenase family) [Bradyrhizobium sp. USDA 4503]